jgi:hypothetical protein
LNPLAKRKRREQQHLRQESTRRKSYSVGSTAPHEVYRPGFPMNMFGNVKIFAGIGVVIVAIFIVTAIWTNPAARTPRARHYATATASASETASATVSPSATPLTFTAAEDVIDETANDYTATVKTNKGDFSIKLYADQAPNTVNSFVFLAKQATSTTSPSTASPRTS